MSVAADDLIAALRAEGLRITAARRAVCEVVADSGTQHLTAADVHERVRRAGSSLDISTVYRTLETLEEAGLVRHGHLGHGPAVYHLEEEASHQHLVCSGCGSTVVLSGSDLASTISLIADRTGFVVDVDHFALAGLCADCSG